MHALPHRGVVESTADERIRTYTVCPAPTCSTRQPRTEHARNCRTPGMISILAKAPSDQFPDEQMLHMLDLTHMPAAPECRVPLRKSGPTGNAFEGAGIHRSPKLDSVRPNLHLASEKPGSTAAHRCGYLQEKGYQQVVEAVLP